MDTVTMNLSVRVAQATEVPQCASLIVAAYNNTGKNNTSINEDSLTYLTDTLNHVVKYGDQLYLAWQNDTLVGCFCLEQRDVGVYELSKFAVHPAFQHQGIGKVMLEKALGILYALQSIAIVCAIFEHCHFVKQWLIDSGFYEVVVGNAAGIPYTLCVMRKDIETSCSDNCSNCSMDCKNQTSL